MSTTPRRGFGIPPAGWIPAAILDFRNSIVSTFMRTQTHPTNRQGTDRMSDGFGHGNAIREIKQMCSDRMVTPDKWVELARESPTAAAAVKASLSKVPVVRHY